VRVQELKRSIKLAFPSHLPHADALALLTSRLTAQGPWPTRPMPREPWAIIPNACPSVLSPSRRQPGQCRAPAAIRFRDERLWRI